MVAKAGPLRQQRAFLCVRKRAQYCPISNKCMKTSHRRGSFRGIWWEKPAKKPPSDEGGGICEANDGGRDWAVWLGAPGCGPGRLHLGPRAAALRRLASKRACGRSLGPSGQFTFSRPTQKRLPPSRGKVRTPRLGGRALQGRTIRRGAQCAPAGGHTGPPLRILTYVAG